MARVVDRLVGAERKPAAPVLPLRVPEARKVWEHPTAKRSTTEIAVKRLMDIVISATALLLLSPLLATVAILLRVKTGPGVLFSQPRVGLNGQNFGCLKFRTMVRNADAALADYLRTNPTAKIEWDATQKLKHDPRVTPFGHFLRKSSLDELPQLVNVLLGQMSCVGPRPVVPSELQKYGVHIAEYLSVRPGLTGPWQVSGRSQLSYADRVALDAEYVRHWSLKRDMTILLKTIPAVTKFEEAA